MGVLEIFVILPIKVTERGFQFPQDVRSEVYLLLQKKKKMTKKPNCLLGKEK